MISKNFHKKKKKSRTRNECEKLAEELHKPVTEKIKRRRVYAWFKDNIWEVDVTEMGSLSSTNQNIKY